MALTTYTLKTGGVEKSLRAWGVTLDFSIQLQSKGKSTASITTVETFDPIATAWIWGQQATIYRDTEVNPDGSIVPGSGTVFFQGYFDDPRMVGAADRQVIQYQLHSIWWLFELNNFKQYTNQFKKFSTMQFRVVAASIVNHGNGYKVGDVLSFAGAPTPATFQVVAIGALGSIVLTVGTNGGGAYNGAIPVSPALAAGGSGGGATFNLTSGPAPVLEQKVVPLVYLGEDLHAAGGYTTLWPGGAGDQIGEVIAWVNEIYNPTKKGATVGRDNTKDVVQAGMIDPHTVMPVTPANTIFCSEAVLQCLRWDPDAVVFEDPTTSPPTLNVRKLGKWKTKNPDGSLLIPPTFIDYSNLPEVTIDITLAQEKQLVVQGQQSKQLAGCIIYYISFDVVDQAVYPAQFNDIFPNDGSINDYTPYVSSHAVQLAGSKLTHVQELVTVNTVAPFALLSSGIPASQAAWWVAQDATLRDPTIAAVAVAGPATVLDDNGNAIDTALFANELTSDLSGWTGQSWVRAHVTQQISFRKYRDPALQVHEVDSNARTHTKTIKLTTALGRLYETLSSFETAESIPQGVAESVFRSLAAAQYAGSIELLDNPLRQPVDGNGVTQPNWIGCRLKLIGPNHTFSNLMVQGVEIQPAKGRTVLTYGPGPVVDIDLWVELARATRSRQVWQLPSNRGDGGSSGGGQTNVDTGANSPSEDTGHGAGGLGYHSVIGPILD